MSLVFDVVAGHLKPQPFESFSSYIQREAKDEEMDSIREITYWLLCNKNPTSLRHLDDYPREPYCSLSKQLNLTEEDLRQTTFHYLATNFGRGIAGKALRPFLSSALHPTLYFCPRCLSEKMYYRLTWRFKELIGCDLHGCRMVNSCSNCNAYIPLVSWRLPPEVGKCPTCEFHLENSPVEELTLEEIARCHQVRLDLEFILRPNQIEMVPVEMIRERIGMQLYQARMLMNVNNLTLTDPLGLPPATLTLLECGILNAKDICFQDYIRYVYAIGITLRDLFQIRLNPREHHRLSSRGNNISRKENDLYFKISSLIRAQRQRNIKVTMESIVGLTGIPETILLQYSKVKRLVSDL